MSINLDVIKNLLAQTMNLEQCELEEYNDSKKGEGLIAEIKRIVLTGKDSEEKLIQKNYVLKTAPIHELYRLSSPIHEIYENEIFAYEKVLPTLEEINESFNVEFVKYPKYCLSNIKTNEEYLILEDLKLEGYTKWDTKQIMDDNHLLLVLENMAKFHAPSFYLKAKNQKLWEDLTRNFINAPKKFFFETLFCDAVIEMGKTLDQLFVNQKDVLEKFVKFRDFELKYFMGQFCCGDDPDFVVTHGDLWCNNVLFKYQDKSNSTKPTQVSFLDYQFIRISSIAIDISYFFYMCATKEAMDSIDTYLLYYYKKLQENLLKMNLEPETIFPYSSFVKQWQDYNKFGFTMALVALHGISSDSSEFPSLEDIIASGKNYWFALNFASKHEKQYHKRIYDVIVHFVNRNYLQ